MQKRLHKKNTDIIQLNKSKLKRIKFIYLFKKKIYIAKFLEKITFSILIEFKFFSGTSKIKTKRKLNINKKININRYYSLNFIIFLKKKAIVKIKID